MICNKIKCCYECEISKKSIKRCPNNNHDICVEVADSRKLIKCEENHKKYTLENISGNFVVSYKIDGGVIVKDGDVPEKIKKCDYAFFINKENTAILVELKGTRVRDSLEQIKSTLNLFEEFLKNFSHVYARIVVASCTPKITNGDKLKLEKKLKENFNGNLKIKEWNYSEKDCDLSKK